ncbi:MAG: hypothetical protein RB191_19865 [Terriglobia bacterium]|nr:hypothetical protein [Terriglobia bacterium]
MDRCLQNVIGDGLSVQRGSDGHWIVIQHEHKAVSFNVENTLSRDDLTRPTILSWIDHQLEYACKTCNGHGTVDVDSDDPKDDWCLDCIGTGIRPGGRPIVKIEGEPGFSVTPVHSTEEDFQHWLTITGRSLGPLEAIPALREAYYAGKDVPPP